MKFTLVAAQTIADALSTVLVIAFVALFAAITLAEPEQTKEVYRIIVHNVGIYLLDYDQLKLHGWQYIRVIILSILALMYLSASIFAMSCILLTRFPPRISPFVRLRNLIIVVLPICLASIPLLAVVEGMLNAKAELLSTDAPISRENLFKILSREVDNRVGSSFFPELNDSSTSESQRKIDSLVENLFNYGLGSGLNWSALFVSIAMLLIIILAYRTLRKRISFGYLISRSEMKAFLFSTIFCTIFALAVSIWSVDLPQWTGPIFIIGLFFSLITAIFGAISYASQKLHLPITVAVVGYVVLLSLNNWSDNHSIRMLTPDVSNAKSDITHERLPELPDALRAWLFCRPDKSDFLIGGKNSASPNAKPYPVYIVAAQGGGIYAASHTALVLANFEKQVPGFRHHLFAISSVSGGSVGASVLASIFDTYKPLLSDDPEPNEECIKLSMGWGNNKEISKTRFNFKIVNAVDDTFAHDLLSPLVAGLAFPDFVQRFSFWQMPKLDRARRLEWALEAAWLDVLDKNLDIASVDKTKNRNLLSKPYWNHWSPTSSGPALIINTTEVSSGARRIFSPYVFNTDKSLHFFDRSMAERVPLSTAAVLSARFPWITPSGWYDDLAGRRRFVDGGYFENSGVTTAHQLYIAVQDAAKAMGIGHQIEVKIIVLTFKSNDNKRRLADEGLNEFADPFRALLNTGVSRALLAIHSAERQLNDSPDAHVCDSNFKGNLMRVELEELIYKLPLGWMWSDPTYLLIRMQKGYPENVEENIKTGKLIGKEFQQFNSDCVIWHLRQQIPSSFIRPAQSQQPG